MEIQSELLFCKGQPEIIFTTTSRMAKLIGYKDEDGSWVQKSLCPWDFKLLPVSQRRSEAARINLITSYFREGLLYHSMPLCRRYDFYVTKEGFPVHLMTYEGRTCVKNLARNPKSGERILGEVVKAISGVLEQSEPWKYAPDLRLDNFCLNSGDSIVFTDIFPPLCLDAYGSYWVHYPNPTDKSIIEREKRRKFTLDGAMRRMRFFLMWIDAAWEEVFEKQLQKNLPASLSNRILREFQVLPDRIMPSLSKKDQLKEIINLPDNQEDVIREMAARLIPPSKERPKALLEIFRNSSAYTDSELRETQFERFRRAKEILIKAAGLSED